MNGFLPCDGGAGRGRADGVREPMHRYTYPITPARCVRVQEGGDGVHTRILETLLEQNQLLSDLLGAVNSLTAAVLALQCHPENLTER